MKLRMFVIAAALVMLGGIAFTAGAADQAAGRSSSAAATGQKPNAVFPQLKYQFDSVVEGTHVTHAFAVKNTGSGTLDIARVKTG
jgi:hypothetical protein